MKLYKTVHMALTYLKILMLILHCAKVFRFSVCWMERTMVNNKKETYITRYKHNFTMQC